MTKALAARNHSDRPGPAILRGWAPWRAFLVVGLLGALAYFLLPGAGLAQALVFLGTELAEVVALAITIRRYRPRGGREAAGRNRVVGSAAPRSTVTVAR